MQPLVTALSSARARTSGRMRYLSGENDGSCAQQSTKRASRVDDLTILLGRAVPRSALGRGATACARSDDNRSPIPPPGRPTARVAQPWLGQGHARPGVARANASVWSAPAVADDRRQAWG